MTWYNPDQLGSCSSWITCTDGEAVQHLHYLPWGEDFVDQRTTDFSARYTFSAKEKDAETGLSYFGSRYYSSDLSIWLSVDPMSDKYPSISPYTYCANNPIKLVDPNGEDLVVANNEESHNDILSIVNESHRNRISFGKDGTVSVNIEGLNIDRLKTKDVGLSLIYDMVKSDKKYYFETSDFALCRNEEGNRVVLPLYDKNLLGCINASVGGLDSEGKHTQLPIEGFDGQVVITKTGSFHYGSQDRRRNIVFHELAENFFRTDKGLNYRGYGLFGKEGAHQEAKSMEYQGWGTREPGTTRFTPGDPSSSYLYKSRIMNYINDGTY